MGICMGAQRYSLLTWLQSTQIPWLHQPDCGHLPSCYGSLWLGHHLGENSWLDSISRSHRSQKRQTCDASNFSTYRRKSTLTMTKKNCHPTSWHWTTLKTSQCNSLNTVICFAVCWRVVMDRLYLLSCYDVMRKIPKFEWARSHHQNICLQSLTAIGDECHLPIVYINRWVVANGP